MGWSLRNQKLRFRKKEILYMDLTRSEQEAWQNSSNVLVVWYCSLLAYRVSTPVFWSAAVASSLLVPKVSAPHRLANPSVQCRLPIVISHLPLSYVVCHVHADNVDNVDNATH